jgi:hypothetical protein
VNSGKCSTNFHHLTGHYPRTRRGLTRIPTLDETRIDADCHTRTRRGLTRIRTLDENDADYQTRTRRGLKRIATLDETRIDTDHHTRRDADRRVTRYTQRTPVPCRGPLFRSEPCMTLEYKSAAALAP